MGFEQVDLFGFSMGGMIAQEIALMEPQFVRKMIIAGTGPMAAWWIEREGHSAEQPSHVRNLRDWRSEAWSCARRICSIAWAPEPRAPEANCVLVPLSGSSIEHAYCPTGCTSFDASTLNQSSVPTNRSVAIGTNGAS